MREFADELRAGIGEAVRKMAEARQAGDDYGAETYRERVSHLRHVARCHGVELPTCPAPDARGEASDGRRGEAARGRQRG